MYPAIDTPHRFIRMLFRARRRQLRAARRRELAGRLLRLRPFERLRPVGVHRMASVAGE
jgi:hypothetical protein